MAREKLHDVEDDDAFTEGDAPVDYDTAAVLQDEYDRINRIEDDDARLADARDLTVVLAQEGAV